MDGVAKGHAAVTTEGNAGTAAAGSSRLAAPAQGAQLAVRARRRRPSLNIVLINVALAVLGLAFVLPLAWVLLSAFDSQASATLQWPHLSLGNFTAIFTSSDNLVSGPFGNSLYLSAVTTIVTTLLAVLAAYPISRRRLRFGRPFLYGILFASGLPLNMLLVPVYSIFVNFNTIDSLTATALFMAATSIPFAIWVLKNFMDAVPIELEEAAQVDGASILQVLFRITLPLALPGLSVTAIFTFLGAWSNFLVPFILLTSPEKLPGAITIYQFQSAHGIIFGQIAAYSLIFSVPVLALYWLASKQFGGAFNFGGGVQG
jgi:multiple sugar transport system permease protein